MNLAEFIFHRRMEVNSLEGWQSGLLRLLGKQMCVHRDAPWVQIPLLPPIMKLYKIQLYWEHIDQKWHNLFPFTCMRKSYAEGAWAMLKAHYGGNKKYRFMIDSKENPEIIDTWDSPNVTMNTN